MRIRYELGTWLGSSCGGNNTHYFLPLMVGVNTSDVPEEMGIPFSVANEFGLTVMQLLPLFALIIVLIGVILAFLWWIR